MKLSAVNTAQKRILCSPDYEADAIYEAWLLLLHATMVMIPPARTATRLEGPRDGGLNPSASKKKKACGNDRSQDRSAERSRSVSFHGEAIQPGLARSRDSNLQLQISRGEISWIQKAFFGKQYIYIYIYGNKENIGGRTQACFLCCLKYYKSLLSPLGSSGCLAGEQP